MTEPQEAARLVKLSKFLETHRAHEGRLECGCDTIGLCDELQALAAQVESAEQRLAAVRPYLQHTASCALYRCEDCGSVADQYIHVIGMVDSHTFVPQSCSCGLAALLESVVTRA